ncbi:hypothetical protein M0813_04672 [Anaeramoeba flamelloides]|uniref:Transmembrane protein n=1 Tax=Anaeramoeba flamelloides TaxID=1746091 RepID=A0ABQ8XJ10_9EUKA|nr:hypothetical protein M0813_04672 [Anaeramoeba flamelloides]
MSEEQEKNKESIEEVQEKQKEPTEEVNMEETISKLKIYKSEIEKLNKKSKVMYCIELFILIVLIFIFYLLINLTKKKQQFM